MKAGESIAVPCPDPRCALFFDSIQDLQCHCQDVHCVERIKLDPIKRRRRTYQSTLNIKVFPNTSIKPKYHCDLLNEESREKRSPSVPSFTISENPLSITDSTSDETELDNSTPASSVNSNLLLSIDPRLLDESDPLLIVRPS